MRELAFSAITLDEESWRSVETVVRRLEESWRESADPDFAPLVPNKNYPLRQRVLLELVKVDQEHRWAAGERKRLEEYLADWPELTVSPATVRELLEAECVIRMELDDPPAEEELRSRFPEVASEIDLAAVAALVHEESSSALAAPLPGTNSIPKTVDFGMAAPDAPPLPAGTKLGRYEIVGVLGRGGMATVYLADDPSLSRRVAVKVPHRETTGEDQDWSWFWKEPQTVARLKRPGIVPVYDVGAMDDGTPYAVMEYVEGRSLKELLAEEQTLEPARALELLLPVVEAVHYAHKQGFIHRDLKPANILIDAEGQPMVADFGLALHESAQHAATRGDSGTLPYMAPEQVRGEAHWVDDRTDVWALGAILYEMLTGRRPFTAESMPELREEILQREPRPPRQLDERIPEALERICLRCLAKPLAERYPGTADLLADLRRWQRPRRKRRAVIGATLLVGMLLVTAVLSVWLGGGLRPAPPTSAPGGSSVPPPLPELSGTLDVLVWRETDPRISGLALGRSGEHSVRTSDKVRIEARLTRPAYVYIVWIDTEGNAAPVYPWERGDWARRPAEETPTDHVGYPLAAGHSVEIYGPAGMETLMLLAREKPLPRDFRLETLFDGLPPALSRDVHGCMRFRDGYLTVATAAADRAGKLEAPVSLRDTLVATQAQLAKRLKPHFTLNRAVSFANQGE